MKKLSLLLLASCAVLFSPGAALALNVYCAPITGFGGESRYVENLTTGNVYVLDSRGCAGIAVEDEAYFQSQGFENLTALIGGGTVLTGSPLVVGTNLFPSIDPAIDGITGTVANIGDRDFIVDDASRLAVGMDINPNGTGPFAYGAQQAQIQAITGNVVTSTLPALVAGAFSLSFGYDRWDPTSNLLVNTAGIKTLYVGQATKGNSGWVQGEYGGGGDNDVNNAFGPPIQLRVDSMRGSYAGMFSSHTNASASNIGTIGVVSFVKHDRPSGVGVARSTWGVYVQSMGAANANWFGAQMIGQEISMVTAGPTTTFATDPFFYSYGGAAKNLALDCGAGPGPTHLNGTITQQISGAPQPLNQCSSALEILTNGNTIARGITFGHNALTVSSLPFVDALVSANPPAIQMPSGSHGYGIYWYSAQATPTWSIDDTSSGTAHRRLHFSDALGTAPNATIQDTDGSNYFQLFATTGGRMVVGSNTGPAEGNYITLMGGSPDSNQNTISFGSNTSLGPILTLGVITGGAGYTDGVYTGVVMFAHTTGTNKARATITVAGGAVTVVTITTPGGDYSVGDTISANNHSITGIGTITAGSGYLTSGVYNAVPLTGGTGAGATAAITVAGGIVTNVVMQDPGANYTSGDVISASNVNLGGSGSGFSFPVSSISSALLGGGSGFSVPIASIHTDANVGANFSSKNSGVISFTPGANNNGFFKITNATSSTTVLNADTSNLILSAANGLQVGGTAALAVSAGNIGLVRNTVAGTGVPPGAAGLKMEVVCSGTTSGTAAIIAYAGTNHNPVYVKDVIGSGVSGC